MSCTSRNGSEVIREVVDRLKGKVHFTHQIVYLSTGESDWEAVEVPRPAVNPIKIFPEVPESPVTEDMVRIFVSPSRCQGMSIEVMGYEKYPGPMSACHLRKGDVTVDEVVAEALKGQVTHG